MSARPLNPKFWTDADRAQLALERATALFNPAEHFTVCPICQAPYVLRRCAKEGSRFLGTFFVSCPTRGCTGKPIFLFACKALVENAVSDPAWRAVLLFPPFLKDDLVDPTRIPKIPGA